jgi:hypothetical protein
MNERIKLLIEQAEEWNADGDKCEVNLQKFAELIVKECMATCSKQAADWEGDYADAHNDGVG